MPPEGATKWMVPDGTIQRRVDAVAGVQVEALDLAAAPIELEVEAAQSLAVEAGDRADLEIEIEIGDGAVRVAPLLAPRTQR